MANPVAVCWSSGKDSAWMLHVLQQDPDVEVRSLITTFNETADRVAMHAVRRELVEAQARAAGLPLWSVGLPWPCSNGEYERRMAEQWARCRAEGITHVAFGDLFLEEIRDYRIAQLAGTGLVPLFPIWCGRDGTAGLAHTMIVGGVRAILTCVDPKQLSPEFLGRVFDESLLRDLPSGVDPCGENGEFHTFCHAAPAFATRLDIRRGEAVERDGFHFLDLTPA
jgi:uncharacterized protein (TIGR00290 family)